MCFPSWTKTCHLQLSKGQSYKTFYPYSLGLVRHLISAYNYPHFLKRTSQCPQCPCCTYFASLTCQIKKICFFYATEKSLFLRLAPKTRAPKTRAPKTRAPKTRAPKTRATILSMDMALFTIIALGWNVGQCNMLQLIDTDSKIVRQTDRQTCRQANRQTDRQIDRQTDRQIDRQTDRQIDRQTDRQMDIQTYRQICRWRSHIISSPYTINLFLQSFVSNSGFQLLSIKPKHKSFETIFTSILMMWLNTLDT